MTESFDFIVVGAGTSGCLLASILALKHPEYKVLLLEAGPDTTPEVFPANSRLFEHQFEHLNYGYTTVPQTNLRNRSLGYAQGKGLGGSSAINRLLWTTGSEDDYNNWAHAVDDDCWSWEHVQNILSKLVRINKDVPEGFDRDLAARDDNENEGSLDVSWPPQWIPEMTPLLRVLTKSGTPWNQDTNSGDPLGFGLVWNSYDKLARSTSYSAFLQPKIPTNLTVRTDSVVQKIIMENKRVVGVEVDGARVSATKEAILCSGAFNTPAILMRSGIGPDATLNLAGVKSVLNLPGVGQNLNDHARVQLLATLDMPNNAAYELKQGFDSSVIGWLKLPEVLASEEYRALSKESQRRISMSKTPTCEFLITVVPNPKDKGTKIISIMVINMNPQSRGSVSITSAKCGDPPVVDPNLIGHEYDRRVMVEGVRMALGWLNDPDLVSCRKSMIQGPKGSSDGAIEDFLGHYADVVWHATGTVAMGQSNDKMACVDPQFKVCGLDNLRVADLSVCPFTPNTHTQSTAYVVGWMAAHKISEEYSTLQNGM